MIPTSEFIQEAVSGVYEFITISQVLFWAVLTWGALILILLAIGLRSWCCYGDCVELEILHIWTVDLLRDLGIVNRGLRAGPGIHSDYGNGATPLDDGTDVSISQETMSPPIVSSPGFVLPTVEDAGNGSPGRVRRDEEQV